MSAKSITRLLSSKNYRIYNADVARKLDSVSASIILSELLDREEFHEDKNELIEIEGEFGWFYQTCEKMEERTALKRKAQDNAIEVLVKLGLIKKVIKDSPPKRFFKLNHEAIVQAVTIKNESTNLSQKDRSICPKRTNQIALLGQIDTSDPYKVYKNPIEKPKETSSPPSISDVDVFSSIPLEAMQIFETVGITKSQYPSVWKESECDLNRVKQAAKLTKSKKPVDIPAYFRTALRDNWTYSERFEESPETNRAAAERLKAHIDSRPAPNKVRVEVCSKYIEISTGISQPFCLDYTDRDFRNKLMAEVNRLNTP